MQINKAPKGDYIKRKKEYKKKKMLLCYMDRELHIFLAY
jgi:hypothetical protein